jgi:cytochrome c-type biogenesis protein CcmE
MRLGGLVADGSVIRGQGKEVGFTVTDTDKEIVVTYVGILPDLFREGQGVIAEGILQPGGKFKADTVLAKHDENYMPRSGGRPKGVDGEHATERHDAMIRDRSLPSFWRLRAAMYGAWRGDLMAGNLRPCCRCAD